MRSHIRSLLAEGYDFLEDLANEGKTDEAEVYSLLQKHLNCTPDEASYILDCWYSDNDAFYQPEGDNMTDAEADADALANIGWGTDEDYGSASETY